MPKLLKRYDNSNIPDRGATHEYNFISGANLAIVADASTKTREWANGSQLALTDS